MNSLGIDCRKNALMSIRLSVKVDAESDWWEKVEGSLDVL